ncbi:MmcQ/YjbR family DNA-binding protein [Blautia wexlerae]|uniref:MmcQ/YjbR family DNA-binding protein n=1 Tax=Blautia wexlerae TaxID=418240 RepID=UPI00325B9D2B
MEREEIFQYVKEQYGTEPEYLWKKDPDSAVLRHKNGKWYADLVGMIIQTYGFLPGYHMNKRHWITILLDDSVSEAKTLDFLDMSYDLIDSGK